MYPLDAIMNFSTFQDSLREGYCAIYEFCSGLFLARFAFLFLKIFIIVVLHYDYIIPIFSRITPLVLCRRQLYLSV